MNRNGSPSKLARALVFATFAVVLCACNQDKADKAADDVSAIRAHMDKQEAERKAAEEENRARFAKLKAQAASDAKTLNGK